MSERDENRTSSSNGPKRHLTEDRYQTTADSEVVVGSSSHSVPQAEVGSHQQSGAERRGMKVHNAIKSGRRYATRRTDRLGNLFQLEGFGAVGEQLAGQRTT